MLTTETKTHKLVTRSTYASELLAAVAATDQAYLLALVLQEVANGPMGPPRPEG